MGLEAEVGWDWRQKNETSGLTERQRRGGRRRMGLEAMEKTMSLV